MLNKALLILVLPCISFVSCREKPQKNIKWDTTQDYEDSIERDLRERDANIISDDVNCTRDSLVQEPLIPTSVQSTLIELPSYKTSDIIVYHSAYTLSFCYETNLANWVAWSLSAERSNGRYKRTDDFRSDEKININHRVDESIYSGTGYDRGHMCPAADNKWSYQAMSESFLMTNICPQNPELNQIWWEHLEKAERRWASQEGMVYICCGPIFNNSTTCIGTDIEVRVPDAFFKVVLSLQKGKEKAIGFYYVNDSSRQTMESAVRTVDEIEQITGFDFFPSLDDELEDRVEQTANLKKWR